MNHRYEYTVIHAPYRPLGVRWMAEERRRFSIPVRVGKNLCFTGTEITETVRRAEVPWRWMAAFLCHRWFLKRRKEINYVPKTTTLYRLEAP